METALDAVARSVVPLAVPLLGAGCGGLDEVGVLQLSIRVLAGTEHEVWITPAAARRLGSIIPA